MRVVIIGAGVIGVTSAYYLAKAGCQVTVIDRCDGPAMDTSFANAGQISPGYAAPWAAPGIPLKALKWLFLEHSPLIIKPQPDLAQWRWMLAMAQNCTTQAYLRNKERMVRLAEYSRDLIYDLADEDDLQFDHGKGGTVQVFRTDDQLAAMQKDIAVLDHFDVPYHVLDRKQLCQAEPGLQRMSHKLVGGLRLPNDGTGDCHKFTRSLARKAASLGVCFQYGQTVLSLNGQGGIVTGLTTDRGTVDADAFVLATGCGSVSLARELGLRLPIYPVKGYSMSVPIADAQRAPRSTIMDETYKVAITRLGNRVRIGGTAELSGYDRKLNMQRIDILLNSFLDLFPDVGIPDPKTLWMGMRPMTPDGTPIIGRTGYSNLFINAGHGTLGWTMSCGSAKLMTDIMLNRDADIRYEDLNLKRFSR